METRILEETNAAIGVVNCSSLIGFLLHKMGNDHKINLIQFTKLTEPQLVIADFIHD